MTALLTPGEVAGLFGVSIPTVRSWVHQGRIEATRTPGNRLRFTHEAVQAAKDRGPDGDTDIRDAGPRAPHRPGLRDAAPPPRWGGCGFPLPEDYRTGDDDGHCFCGAPYPVHS